MDPESWFLTARERGNASTVLDRRHHDERAWTVGNSVVPLVHGGTYFSELHQRVDRMVRGDLLMFVDWRGDPDERLTDESADTVAELFCRAARRGVDVRGLVWRSHWDRLAFSSRENRHLGERINEAGGQVVLDMRVRTGGSHHQKFVILRHPGQEERDVAFLGGIDLCHSRRDDERHLGDPQTQPMADVYGDRPAWHDVQLRIQGPAVGDVEAVFRERWDDPQALSRSPIRRIADQVRRTGVRTTPLPPQLPDPGPHGQLPVQLLRTYPKRLGGYPFAPQGERSVARGYAKALALAERLIYVEDQYLWSPQVTATFVRALRRNPQLHLVAVLPHFPDQDGRVSMPPNLVGRQHLMTQLRRAAPGRVAFYGIENDQGTPIYVHAKVCIVDDVWASVGSDNFNRRSWTHDSELAAAVCDPGYARSLRLTMIQEHLEGAHDLELEDTFTAFANAARDLQAWYDAGRTGARPAGRVRPIGQEPLSRSTLAWAAVLYRLVYDPDGRPFAMRLSRRF